MPRRSPCSRATWPRWPPSAAPRRTWSSWCSTWAPSATQAPHGERNEAHLAFRATTAVAAGNVTLASVLEALRAAAPIVAAAEVAAIDPAADALVLDAITRRNPDDARRAARAGRALAGKAGDGRN